MEKCSCYRTKETYVSFDPYNIRKRTVGYCNGTKEQEECGCGGNKAKCDFYQEVREEAKQNVTIKEAISHYNYGINYDIFKEPVTSYAKMAVEALEKQIPKKPNVGVQNFLKCSCCHSVVRTTDNYCHECGNMLDWKY